MPRIGSNQIQINQPIEAAAPDATLVVDADAARPLSVGAHVFQLEVVDDSGLRSQPERVTVVVADTQAPTAVIRAPRTVPFGQAITLNGGDSVDVGGRIVRYVWTLIQ